MRKHLFKFSFYLVLTGTGVLLDVWDAEKSIIFLVLGAMFFTRCLTALEYN